MPIAEFQQKSLRFRVGIFGHVGNDAREVLERRGYELYDVSLSSLPSDILLGTTDCLIVVQRPGDPMRKELIASAAALTHDCRVYVQRMADQDSVARLDHTMAALRAKATETRSAPPAHADASCFRQGEDPLYAPFFHLFTAEGVKAWEDHATVMGRNPAGPEPFLSLKITGDHAERLTPEQRTLLQRAFYDCREVRLIGKMNGLSGIGTYEVHAYLKAHEVGSNWPARFFAKLGSRGVVLQEYRKYREKALENVPFHLGPRLRMDRCSLGATQGLIVSDYVAGAEALRDSAREGRGTVPIANLFNQTLWAWRRGAKDEPVILGDKLLPRLTREPPEHRIERYAALGATRGIGDLRAQFKFCQSTPVLIGVVHGDLHATNVLVRQGDAVIIDLADVDSGRPLLFDAASLEGGLLIDGFLKGDSRPINEILRSILPLYRLAAFADDDHFCELHSQTSWYFDSVRQIRMQARQLERGGPGAFQYAWTLAAVLLAKSCNGQDFTKLEDGSTPEARVRREEIRAMSWVVAETILSQLAKATVAPAAEEERA
jgi:hypothetical protein